MEWEEGGIIFILMGELWLGQGISIIVIQVGRDTIIHYLIFHWARPRSAVPVKRAQIIEHVFFKDYYSSVSR